MANLTDIYGKIDTFCDQNQLLTPNAKVLIALSGGADSVFLLRYLVTRGYEVVAAHCNFHLRDNESIRDEQFVRHLCQTLHVPLTVKDFNTKAFAQQEHVSIEMAARTQRYEWFESLLQQVKAQSIAVAHHQDDNIESVLLNLVRGTGIKGLCGMQPRNGHIIRPLLCISRTDILAGLNELQQPYVDDSTNFDNHYSRNRVRLDVMPMLSSINPGVRENILTTIENLNEVHKTYVQSIQTSIETCCHHEGTTLYINKQQLSTVPSPQSVLHAIMEPLGFNRSQTLQLLRCNHVGRQFHSPTHTALIDRDYLLIADKHTTDTAVKITTVDVADCILLRDERHAYFDADQIEGELMIRPVQAGDRFRPFGMKGQKLISDLLTDLKVNRFDKEEQLVVCDSCRILWVVGRRAADDCKVTAATRRVVCMEV